MYSPYTLCAWEKGDLFCTPNENFGSAARVPKGSLLCCRFIPNRWESAPPHETIKLPLPVYSVCGLLYPFIKRWDTLDTGKRNTREPAEVELLLIAKEVANQHSDTHRHHKNTQILRLYPIEKMRSGPCSNNLPHHHQAPSNPHNFTCKKKDSQ